MPFKTDYLEQARNAKKRIVSNQQILREREVEHLIRTDEVQDIIRLYEAAFNRLNSFRTRLRAFLKAENEMGRKLGKVLDLVSFLDPRIETAREFVRRRIIPIL